MKSIPDHRAPERFEISKVGNTSELTHQKRKRKKQKRKQQQQRMRTEAIGDIVAEWGGNGHQRVEIRKVANASELTHQKQKQTRTR